jgi:hypothetical protein
MEALADLLFGGFCPEHHVLARTWGRSWQPESQHRLAVLKIVTRIGASFQFGQVKTKATCVSATRSCALSAMQFFPRLISGDLRQPTNVIEHTYRGLLPTVPHVQVGATGLIGRQIVNAQSPTLERWLKRWQFDTIYSF